jgi:cysteine desulfurase family protein
MSHLEPTGGTNDSLIYLDNAATTFPKPKSVYNEANAFYMRYGGNAGRGGNPLARACTRLLTETRELLAEWLGAPSYEHVIFTASATHALNQAIFGTALDAGDIVYVSPFEHNSVLRPIEYLRQTKGIQVREIPFVRRTYMCQMDKLAAAFQTEPPALVCVTQASNVCGVMPLVQEIAHLAKRANSHVVVVVDGAQVAGLYPLSLKEGIIDALIFSGHKSLYGPYGVAGLVLGSAWRPRPLLFGGTGTFSESIEMPRDLPSAYEAGSHNIWAIAGLNAAIHWMEQTGRETLATHGLRLAKQLCLGLSDLPGVKVHAPFSAPLWSGIISFIVEGLSPQAVEAALGAKGIAVRAGLHCAPWAHRWLGTIQLGGTVRVSTGYFNTTADVETFLTAMGRILNSLS